ncbi:MAG: PAS domain-containing protein, partial [Methyloceanibacter sp.]
MVSWNSGAQRLKGYQSNEIIGQSFARFFTAEDQTQGLPQRALANARTEERFESDGWCTRKDVSRFCVGRYRRHPCCGDGFCQDHTRHNRAAKGARIANRVRYNA